MPTCNKSILQSAKLPDSSRLPLRRGIHARVSIWNGCIQCDIVTHKLAGGARGRGEMLPAYDDAAYLTQAGGGSHGHAGGGVSHVNRRAGG